MTSKRILSYLFVYCLTWSLSAHGQNVFNIPVVDGRVFFSDTLATGERTACCYDNLHAWLQDSLVPALKEKGAIAYMDTANQQILCRVTEYLEIEKSNLSVFALYMRYTLIITCSGDETILEVANIGYIEPEDVKRRDEVPIYSAEFIFIDKKYKLLFVKNAPAKIADKTIERVNELFSGIHAQVR